MTRQIARQPMKIKQLMERYQLKTRQALYNRLDCLNLKLNKNESGINYAIPEHIDLLDQLDRHLKEPGATLTNFTPLSSATIDAATDSSIETSFNPSPEKLLKRQVPSPGLTSDTELMVRLIEAIAQYSQPRSPLWYHAELEKASISGWLLTTREIKQLLGVKPVCKPGETTYQRGGWQFIKSGKIGGQTAWHVQKLELASVNSQYPPSLSI
jgi:hypothetical protein